MAQQNLDLIIRARNETAQGLASALGDFNRLGYSVTRFIGTTLVVSSAIKMAAAVRQMYGATRDFYAANAKGAEAAYEAQIGINAVWESAARSVPVLGRALGALTEAFQD